MDSTPSDPITSLLFLDCIIVGAVSFVFMCLLLSLLTGNMLPMQNDMYATTKCWRCDHAWLNDNVYVSMWWCGCIEGLCTSVNNVWELSRSTVSWFEITGLWILSAGLVVWYWWGFSNKAAMKWRWGPYQILCKRRSGLHILPYEMYTIHRVLLYVLQPFHLQYGSPPNDKVGLFLGVPKKVASAGIWCSSHRPIGRV